MVHATCVAVGGDGALIRGPVGSGKSDLALRLIDAGAELVADDQVILQPREGRLWASAPATLAGLIEARGIGIGRLAHRSGVFLGAVFDLSDPCAIRRIPEPEFVELTGIRVPRFALAPFESSAAAKLRLALAFATGRLELHHPDLSRAYHA